MPLKRQKKLFENDHFCLWNLPLHRLSGKSWLKSVNFIRKMPLKRRRLSGIFLGKNPTNFSSMPLKRQRNLSTIFFPIFAQKKVPLKRCRLSGRLSGFIDTDAHFSPMVSWNRHECYDVCISVVQHPIDQLLSLLYTGGEIKGPIFWKLDPIFLTEIDNYFNGW